VRADASEDADAGACPGGPDPVAGDSRAGREQALTQRRTTAPNLRIVEQRTPKPANSMT
jgi:hypothetical protein